MNVRKNTINCRICLQCDPEKSNKCLSLFENYNCSISEKIILIADIKITEGDGLPDTICPDCLLQLENAVTFKQKCEASDKILRCSILLTQQCPEQETKNGNKSKQVKEEEIKTEINSILDEHCRDYYESDGRIDNATTRSQNGVDKPLLKKNYSNLDEHCTDYYDTEDRVDEATTCYPNNNEHRPLLKSRAIDLKLICDDCGGSFKSKCKMRVHWKNVHLAETLICPKCKRIFKSYKAFNIHKNKQSRNCEAATKVHIEGQGKSRTYQCKECSYKTRRIKDIGTHLAIHTGDRHFQCKDCHKTFTQHSSLQSHRETRHNDYRVETTCHLCGKHLQGRAKFYKHMRTHKTEAVQCKVCNKTLKGKKYLALHMLRHSGVKSFSCEICAASFFTYCELYNHRTKVHLKSRNLKCDLCDYKMCTKTALLKHRSKHTGSNIICLVCGQFSENAEKFALHQKRHLERNIACPQCDKKYHNKSSLNKHMCKSHRCKMLVRKRDETTVTDIKEESPPHRKEEIVILLSPPTLILK